MHMKLSPSILHDKIVEYLFFQAVQMGTNFHFDESFSNGTSYIHKCTTLVVTNVIYNSEIKCAVYFTFNQIHLDIFFAN